jgi:hypothetical protein
MLAASRDHRNPDLTRRVLGIVLVPVFLARMAASPNCREAATAVLAFAPARRARAMKHSVRSGPDIASQDCAVAALGAAVVAATATATPVSIETAKGAWRHMTNTVKLVRDRPVILTAPYGDVQAGSSARVTDVPVS